MSVAGRGKGALGSIIPVLTRQVSIPGTPSGAMTGLNSNTSVLVHFTQVDANAIPTLILTDDMQSFTVHEDGYYNLRFSCHMPEGGSAPATGFGTGWSGSGNGGIQIYTNRYGMETLGSFGPQGAGDWFMDSGFIKRYLYSGDYIQFYVFGGATGNGPWVYFPTGVIQKLRS